VTEFGLVVFGDVVGSRKAGPASTAWLRSLVHELDEAYGDERLAPFAFTQGDELQGLLRSTADPLEAVFRAALREEDEPPAMRWVIAAGLVEPGSGPATERAGPAFLEARSLTSAVRRHRDLLAVRSGDPATDDLLDDVAPPLGRLLADLTDRQRLVGRLLLVERLRQSEVADRLEIARPTVSVVADRAHVRDLQRLRHAVVSLIRTGIERATEAAA
jgi:predicted XRE-type DNA-binding protein